ALVDWIAALEWEQVIIRAFGGDRGRVSLGGQSAGGGAALALLASPRVRGLFHRVVCHSGPLPDIPLEVAEHVGAQMARACEVSEHDRAGWREVPRQEIVAAERARDRGDLLSAAGRSGG